MKTLTLLGLMILGAWVGHAQQADWQAQTYTDQKFSITSPVSLSKVPYFEAELGVWNNEDRFFDTQYMASQQKGAYFERLAVIVIGPQALKESLKILRKRREGLSDMVEYMAVTFLADDDETQFLSKPKSLVLGKVTATEYRYENDDKVNNGSGKLYSRGIVLHQYGRIYVVVFVGVNRENLDSKDAERFLLSFQPLK